MDRAEIENKLVNAENILQATEALSVALYLALPAPGSQNEPEDIQASDVCFLLRLAKKFCPDRTPFLVEHAFQRPPSSKFTKALIDEVLSSPEDYASDVLLSALAAFSESWHFTVHQEEAMKVKSLLWKAVASRTEKDFPVPLPPSQLSILLYKTRQADIVDVKDPTEQEQENKQKNILALTSSEIPWQKIVVLALQNEKVLGEVEGWLQKSLHKPQKISFVINSFPWPHERLFKILSGFLEKINDENLLTEERKESVACVFEAWEKLEGPNHLPSHLRFGLCRDAHNAGFSFNLPPLSKQDRQRFLLSTGSPEVFEKSSFQDIFGSRYGDKAASLSVSVLESFLARPTLYQQTEKGAVKLDKFRAELLKGYSFFTNDHTKKEVRYAILHAAGSKHVDKKGFEALVKGLHVDTLIYSLEGLFSRSIFGLPKNFIKSFAKHMSVDDLSKVKPPDDEAGKTWWRDYLVLRSRKNLAELKGKGTLHKKTHQM